MPQYNTKFELSVEDMDLIEDALLKSRSEVECQKAVGAVQDLLGRLHNQKVFYRPQQGYLGG
ncbi:MAG: hypothetical protein HKN27_14820 [Silicimonas sp.]|nr:hypothetical protein [Silicimonas sp.]